MFPQSLSLFSSEVILGSSLNALMAVFLKFKPLTGRDGRGGRNNGNRLGSIFLITISLHPVYFALNVIHLMLTCLSSLSFAQEQPAHLVVVTRQSSSVFAEHHTNLWFLVKCPWPPHYAFPKRKVPSNNKWTSPADSSDCLSVYMPSERGWRISNKLFDVLNLFSSVNTCSRAFITKLLE
jgi:hypothetical protein